LKWFFSIAEGITPILIIAEDIRLAIFPNHDMVQCSGNIQSRLSRHVLILLMKAYDPTPNTPNKVMHRKNQRPQSGPYVVQFLKNT